MCFRTRRGTELVLTPVVLLLDTEAAELLDPRRPELALLAAWAMHNRHGPKAVKVVERALEGEAVRPGGAEPEREGPLDGLRRVGLGTRQRARPIARITQRDCHKENAAALVELVRFVMLLGGPRIDHPLAVELGFVPGGEDGGAGLRLRRLRGREGARAGRQIIHGQRLLELLVVPDARHHTVIAQVT